MHFPLANSQWSPDRAIHGVTEFYFNSSNDSKKKKTWQSLSWNYLWLSDFVNVLLTLSLKLEKQRKLNACSLVDTVSL